MSGSYYSDYQMIEQFSAMALGGHRPDEESEDIIKDMKEDHRKEVAELLTAWAEAFRVKE
jgi:hypothetical protein